MIITKRYDGGHVYVAVNEDTLGRHAYFVMTKTIPPVNNEPHHETPYGFHGGVTFKVQKERVEAGLGEDCAQPSELISKVRDLITATFVSIARYDSTAPENIAVVETDFPSNLECFLQERYEEESVPVELGGVTYFLHFYLAFDDDSKWRQFSEKRRKQNSGK